MNIENLRKLVIFHLYYQEMWDIFIPYLKNLEEISGFDLFITVTKEDREVFSKIKSSFSSKVNIKIQIVENLGADLYPFLEVINSIDLEQYDIIYKIHTKRDMKQRSKIENISCGLIYWREFMLNDILGKSLIKSRLQDFIDNNKLGVSGFYPYLVFVHENNSAYHNSKSFITENKICNVSYVKDFSFYAGTIFMIRPCLLKCLQGNFDKEQFRKIDGNNKFSVYAYLMEAYLGYIVAAQDYEYKQGSKIQKFILKLLSHRITYPLFRYYADNIILKK